MATSLVVAQPATVTLSTALTEIVIPQGAVEVMLVPSDGTVRLYGTGIDGGSVAGLGYLPVPTGGLVVPRSGRLLLAASSGTPTAHCLAV